MWGELLLLRKVLPQQAPNKACTVHGEIAHPIANNLAFERTVLNKSLFSFSCRPEAGCPGYLVSDIEPLCKTSPALAWRLRPDDSLAVGGSLKIVAGKVRSRLRLAATEQRASRCALAKAGRPL